MSQSRRFSKIAAVIAAGMFALFAAVPTTAGASTPAPNGAQQTSTLHGPVNGGGGGWCC